MDGIWEIFNEAKFTLSLHWPQELVKFDRLEQELRLFGVVVSMQEGKMH